MELDATKEQPKKKMPKEQFRKKKPVKYYNCGKPGYIKQNYRQSNKVNQRIGYVYTTQNISKKELKKILKQALSPTPTKQLIEEDLENLSDYELMDIEEYADTQIRD